MFPSSCNIYEFQRAPDKSVWLTCSSRRKDICLVWKIDKAEWRTTSVNRAVHIPYEKQDMNQRQSTTWIHCAIQVGNRHKSKGKIGNFLPGRLLSCPTFCHVYNRHGNETLRKSRRATAKKSTSALDGEDAPKQLKPNKWGSANVYKKIKGIIYTTICPCTISQYKIKIKIN